MRMPYKAVATWIPHLHNPEVFVDIFKKILPYLGAVILAVLAFAGLVTTLSGPKDSPEYWTSIEASFVQIATASDMAANTAVTNEDYVPCVTAKSSSALATGLAASAGLAGTGICSMPAVDLDITACFWDAEAPVVAEGEAAPVVAEAAPVVAEGEAAPAAPVVSRVAAGTNVPEAVELAVGPLVAIVKSVIENSDASANAKAWGTGVLTWLDSGRASIIALIENPGTGVVTFDAVAIEGCSTL
jgi:hypothetical protein